MNSHDAIMDKYIADLDKLVQRSVLLSGVRVPKATRKLSGQAQASTRMGINSADTSVTLAAVYAPNAITNSIAVSVGKITSASKNAKVGDKIYITNNLPYITVVEYKYGDLMFNKAIAHWQQDVDSAASSL